MGEFKIGDYVEVVNSSYKERNGQKGFVSKANESAKTCRVELSNETVWFYDNQLLRIEKSSEAGKFQEIANNIGAFTDDKNKQYGSSVDATYDMMKVLMERYSNEDDTYTIPKSLLPHLLLQVRMMDKQNRIFNNPSGKGDSESPYKDLTGYSLIGVDMVERLKQDTK